jgi:hypothetical protein
VRRDAANLTFSDPVARQVARLTKKLPEFSRKEITGGSSPTSLVIDERMQVECLYAPHDAHSPENFCKWCFAMKRE